MPFVRSTVIFNKEKSLTYLVVSISLSKLTICVLLLLKHVVYIVSNVHFLIFIHSRAKRNAYNVYSLYKATNTKGFENKEISNRQLNKKLS